MTQWQAKFNVEFVRHHPNGQEYMSLGMAGTQTLRKFIETEIIEQIINKIPDYVKELGNPYHGADLKPLKEKLRDRYLTNQNQLTKQQ